MEVIDLLKKKANRAFLLSQRARTEARKRKLRELYCHYYNTYKRQKLLVKEIDSLSVLTHHSSRRKETTHVQI